MIMTAETSALSQQASNLLFQLFLWIFKGKKKKKTFKLINKHKNLWKDLLNEAHWSSSCWNPNRSVIEDLTASCRAAICRMRAGNPPFMSLHPTPSWRLERASRWRCAAVTQPLPPGLWTDPRARTDTVARPPAWDCGSLPAVKNMHNVSSVSFSFLSTAGHFMQRRNPGQGPHVEICCRDEMEI